MSVCFSHAYTSLQYGEHALKKACAYKQAFYGNIRIKIYFNCEINIWKSAQFFAFIFIRELKLTLNNCETLIS